MISYSCSSTSKLRCDLSGSLTINLIYFIGENWMKRRMKLSCLYSNHVRWESMSLLSTFFLELKIISDCGLTVSFTQVYAPQLNKSGVKWKILRFKGANKWIVLPLDMFSKFKNCI